MSFFNFSKCRCAPHLSHQWIYSRHSSSCLVLTPAKLSVNSVEVLMKEYRICFHFPLFSFINFLSSIKTRMSRSLAISDMHSDMKSEAVLGFMKNVNFVYSTSQRIPKAWSPSHRVLWESGILWFRVTSEVLDQAFIYTYCVTSILWKLHLKKVILLMHSEAKPKQKLITKLYGRGIWGRRDLLQSGVMVHLFLSRKVLSFTLEFFTRK